MANQITDNRTLVDSAEAATNYDDLTGATAGTADNEIFIQGSNSIGQYITTTRDGLLYDAGSAQDWSGNVFYLWINCGIVGLLDTKANGGMAIRFCGATVTDWFEVYVAGSDNWPAAVQGGWTQFVVDIDEARSQAVTNGWTNGTTPATTAIRYVGYSAITAATMPRMVDNTWLDEIRRLPANTPGIIVEGRNAGTTDWDSADIYAQLGDAVGTFVPSTGGAWKINTPIQFGINDTTTHGFTDTNAIWLWDNAEFVPDDVYRISALGNAGGTTNITMGVKTGTGDTATGAQGLTIASASDGPRWDIDFDDPNLDAISLYGCAFQHGGTFQLDDPAVECISNLYIDCVQAVVGQNSLQLSCAVIQPANGDGVAFMQTDDLLDIRFCTFEFLDGHAIEITDGAVDPQENRGNLFNGSFDNVGNGNDAAIYNNSTSDLTINNTNNSNLNTNSYRNGTSSTTTIQNSVSVSITVQDTLGNPIEGAKVFLEEAAGSGTITEVAQTSAQDGTGSTAISVTHGFTLSANDVVIAIIHTNTAGNNVTDNNGADAFTLQSELEGSGGNVIGVWYRVMDGTEGSTFDFTADVSQRWSITVRQLRGVDTANVFDVAPSSTNRTNHGSSPATAQAAGITTNTNNALAMAVWFGDSNLGSAFSGYTLSYANEVEAGGQNTASVTLAISTAGAITGPTATYSGAATVDSWHFAIKPASADGADVIPYDLTDVNGQVSATFSGSTPQDVTGFVRKGSVLPVYKAAPINDTITGSGLTATVTLVED